MESIIKALKELSDLIRTRFKEVTIIALSFAVYKQQIYQHEQDAGHKAEVEKLHQELEDKNQQIIVLFRGVMDGQQKLLYRANDIMNKADTIISR